MKRFLAPTLLGFIVVACGGASATDIIDTSANDTAAGTDSGTSSGTVDAGSSGKTDSGTIGSGADSGGGAVDSGGGSGACTIDANGVSTGCNKTQYCVSNNCATGTCAPIPTGVADNSYDAQCGCDNVNYWNAEVAHSNGQSVKSPGTCPAPLSCTTGKCAAAPYGCEIQQTACDVSLNPTTACWGVPATCPETAGATTFVRECNSSNPTKCVSQCDAFTAKVAYVLAAACN